MYHTGSDQESYTLLYLSHHIKVSPPIELIQQSTGCDEYYKWVIMKTLTITTELLPTFGPIL